MRTSMNGHSGECTKQNKHAVSREGWGCVCKEIKNQAHTPTWKLEWNGAGHFGNFIEVWDKDGNAPVDMKEAFEKIKRAFDTHSALLKILEKIKEAEFRYGEWPSQQEIENTIAQAEGK